MRDLAINQPSDGDYPFSMHLAMMAIGLGDGFIAPQPPNGVLNDDATARKGGIVDDVFGRPGLTGRLTSGGGPQAVRVELIDANIGQIANRTHLIGQAVEQI